MKRMIAVIAILLIVLFGGCHMREDVKPSEMDPNDLPDERAFQDEFTREFLQSTEETRPGYYSFLSKTEKYKMDFPAKGIINKKFYNINKNSHEMFNVSFVDDNDIKIEYSLAYYEESDKKDIDTNLAFFKGRIGQDTNFEVIESKNHNIYNTNYNISKFYKHAAYIQNIINPGGIEIIFTIHCKDETNCKNNELIEQINDLIMSIEFVN